MMLPSILLAAMPPELQCELLGLELTDTHVCLRLSMVAPAALCPQCQVASRRVHSRYTCPHRKCGSRPPVGCPAGPPHGAAPPASPQIPLR